jgi:hypothetical protein
MIHRAAGVRDGKNSEKFSVAYIFWTTEFVYDVIPLCRCVSDMGLQAATCTVGKE